MLMGFLNFDLNGNNLHIITNNSLWSNLLSFDKAVKEYAAKNLGKKWYSISWGS